MRRRSPRPASYVKAFPRPYPTSPRKAYPGSALRTSVCAKSLPTSSRQHRRSIRQGTRRIIAEVQARPLHSPPPPLLNKSNSPGGGRRHADHLKANPNNSFAPLFDFFEPWCQDENRHGDIFNMLIRCWPGLRQGWRGQLLSRFFLWSVFLTHSLTVCERGSFYTLLGMDPSRFDEDVMRQTNHTARRAFPVVFKLDGTAYVQLRDQLVETYRAIKATTDHPLSLNQVLKRLGLQGRFVGLLVRQFLQPMESSGQVIP